MLSFLDDVLWNSEEKCRPIADFRFYPNFTLVHFNNLFHDRKARAASFIFFPPMQSLEDNKYFFIKLPRDTYAIVLDVEKIRIIFSILKSDFHHRIGLIVEFH